MGRLNIYDQSRLLLLVGALAACSSSSHTSNGEEKRDPASGIQKQSKIEIQPSGKKTKKNSQHSKTTNDLEQPETPISLSPVGGKNGWTTFRGAPHRRGQADVVGPRTANLKWVFRTRGRIYADGAITPDGETIYVASHDKHLYAVGADGLEKWSYNSDGKIWTSPSIGDNGVVYFGTDNDMMLALNPDGSKLWAFVTTEKPGPKEPKPEVGRYDVDTSPLLLGDGTVVFGCHLRMYALRPMSGELRWLFDAGVGRSKIFSSPAGAPDGTIYFGTQGRYFFALNDGGKAIWNIQSEGDNDSTPVVGNNGTVYMGSDDKFVRAVSPKGQLLWKSNVGGPIRAPLALSDNGTLYAATYGREPVMIALEAATGIEKWRFAVKPGEGDFYGIQSGATIDAEGYIYFGARDGWVYCLDPDGKLVWKYETGDQVDASGILGPDGTLYIGSDDKRLYAFKR